MVSSVPVSQPIAGATLFANLEPVIVQRLARSQDDLVIMTTPPADLPVVAEPLLDNPLNSR